MLQEVKRTPPGAPEESQRIFLRQLAGNARTPRPRGEPEHRVVDPQRQGPAGALGEPRQRFPLPRPLVEPRGEASLERRVEPGKGLPAPPELPRHQTCPVDVTGPSNGHRSPAVLVEHEPAVVELTARDTGEPPEFV